MSSSKSQSNKPPLNYGSPCAACKFLRKKCPPDCIFAPHFPPDQPRKFEIVHRIYGASNVSKILNQLSYDQRKEAVTSLLYEAEARINEPVRGCTSFVSILQEKLKKLQIELSAAQKELSTYMVSEPQAVKMPFDGSSSLPAMNQPFDDGIATDDGIQPHVVDHKSNVRLLKQELQPHSFDSQQQTIAEEKPWMIIHQPQPHSPPH